MPPPIFTAISGDITDSHDYYRVYCTSEALYFVSIGTATDWTSTLSFVGWVGSALELLLRAFRKQKPPPPDLENPEAAVLDPEKDRKLPLSSIVSATLSAPYFWELQEVAGRLKIECEENDYEDDGVQLLLATPSDVHVVLGNLPLLLRKRMTIEAKWHEKKKRYVGADPWKYEAAIDAEEIED